MVRSVKVPAVALAAVLGSAAASSLEGQPAIRWVENISFPAKPGFAQLPPQAPGKLIVTVFDPIPLVGKMGVFSVDVSRGAAGEPTELPGSERIDWPNTATGVDESVFGFPGLAIGSGFLVPTHTTGAIWLLEAATAPQKLPAPLKLTTDKSGWFYHQAALVDVDGDGRKDILTARCTYPVLPWSQKKGELIWLKQPETNPLSGNPWVEQHLADGPDFLFCVRPGNGSLALAAAEFVGGRITYFEMKDGKLQSRVIDDKSGPGFSCSWVDLNGDGREELLATNHQNKNGSVFAYTFDSEDLSAAGITRHVLATGFSAVSSSQGNASPGDAIAFSPTIGAAGKPHIMLSGDNSNSAFVLAPNSEEQQDWGYTVQKIGDFGGDIGRPAVGDTNGDGFADVYVPLYDGKMVAHFSYGPADVSRTVVV